MIGAWSRWRLLRVTQRIQMKQQKLRLLRSIAFELRIDLESQRLAREVIGYVNELEGQHGEVS